METIGSRMKHLRLVDFKGISQGKFGEILGVGHGSINKIEYDKHPPTSQMLKKLLDEYQISTDWILSGIGDKKIDADKAKLLAEIDRLTRINNSQRTLLHEYMNEETIKKLVATEYSRSCLEKVGEEYPSPVLFEGTNSGASAYEYAQSA